MNEKPKEVIGMPDFYTVDIEYTNGRKEKLEIVERDFIGEQVRLENGVTFYKTISAISFIKRDGTHMIRPWCNIIGIDYDKNYSKIVELWQENNKKGNG